MDTVPKSKRIPPKATKSRKGVPNKATAAIKDMIIQALDGAGGVEYLINCANDPRCKAAFLGLVGKVLPTQVTGADGGALQMSMEVIFRKPDGC